MILERNPLTLGCQWRGVAFVTVRLSRSAFVQRKGRARADLGDTMRVVYGVADLGGRILKWAKTDEKL